MRREGGRYIKTGDQVERVPPMLGKKPNPAHGDYPKPAPKSKPAEPAPGDVQDDASQQPSATTNNKEG